MTEFNDAVKNVAINSIVSFLQNPEGKSPLAQVSLILETVQNAYMVNDKETCLQSNLAKFFEPFINEIAATRTDAVPEFLADIIFPEQKITISNVATILAILRCFATKEEHSEFIINHLTYFIEYLKENHKATIAINKYFCFEFSEYRNDASEAIKWGLEAFNAPVYIKFKSPEEWREFRKAMSNKKEYQCLCQGDNVIYPAMKIDEFEDTMYPIEIAVNNTNRNPNISSVLTAMGKRKALQDSLKKPVSKSVSTETTEQQNTKVTTNQNIAPVKTRRFKIIPTVICCIIAIACILTGVKLNRNLKEANEKLAEIENSYNTQNNYSNSAQSNQETRKPNRPNWLKGSWRVPLDDVSVLIVNLNYTGDAKIQIMRGFEMIDSMSFDNWTAIDGIVYMYNGNDKSSGAKLMYNEVRKTVTHNGRIMQKHP